MRVPDMMRHVLGALGVEEACLVAERPLAGLATDYAW